MAFDIPAGQNLAGVQVAAAMKSVQAIYEVTDNRVVIELAELVVINAGQEIEVTIHW
jgi:hypothetical protein